MEEHVNGNGSQDVPIKGSGVDFSTSTPLKPDATSNIQDEEKPEKLPEKFDGIMEFFRRMITSVRLLGLQKSTATFQKISKRVELLTGRKFGAVHLAQIKYILPEAVQIEKILVHDVQTMCMKPDMKIQLIFDIVHDHGEVSEFVALSNLFKSRLYRFYRGNPEACDIPEAELLELYNAKSNTVTEKLLSDNLPEMDKVEMSNSASRRHVCMRTSVLEMEKTDLQVIVNSNSEAGASNEVDSKTPLKSHLTLDNIHVKTPAQSTPMRKLSPTMSVLTCEDECKKVTSSSKCLLLATTNAKKSLDFYNTVESEPDSDSFSQKETSLRSSDVVFMIHRAFKSVNFRPMTREELVFNIVSDNLEITNRGHVEACMEKIEKLAPNWFWKEDMARGANIFHYKLKKVADLKYICELVDCTS